MNTDFNRRKQGTERQKDVCDRGILEYAERGERNSTAKGADRKGAAKGFLTTDGDRWTRILTGSKDNEERKGVGVTADGRERIDTNCRMGRGDAQGQNGEAGERWME